MRALLRLVTVLVTQQCVAYAFLSPTYSSVFFGRKQQLSSDAVTSFRRTNLFSTLSLSATSSGAKVVVFGGSGFVGSRLVEQLIGEGCEVMGVSKSGTPPSWGKEQGWANKASWLAGDVSKMDVASAIKGASAVVSCVGVIGGSDEAMQEGNGAMNCKIAEAASQAGCSRFVYVSVSEAVENAVGSIALKGYFAGKRDAEAKIKELFPDTSVIIAPTFIYGGEEFSATPPRVAAWYGSLVEKALSLGPVRSVASALLPSPLGLALLPPVNVDSVAAAAAGGAGGITPVFTAGDSSLLTLAMSSGCTGQGGGRQAGRY